MKSTSSENYLKEIYHLQPLHKEGVPTSAIAASLGARPASVSEMLGKLKRSGWITHEKYHGVKLTVSGRRKALEVVRKHRLWEYFLVETLGFGWDEVHEMAEQLEHIQSPALTNRLDQFLGYPKADPHGDPIPDANGKMAPAAHVIPANHLKKLDHAIVTGVENTSPEFLRYLDQQSLRPGAKFKVKYVEPFDGSMVLQSGRNERIISLQAARYILVTRPKKNQV